jgi:hypothetical protein
MSCPTCASTTPSNCVCPDLADNGELVVMDDNCRPRRLIGKGLAYQPEGGTTQLTDGSEANGLIQLKPPTTPSGAGLTVTDANGTVLRLDQFKEGDILTIEGGQIVFKSNQDQKNTYDPAQLRDGVGRLAVFICGPNGTNSLGRYDGCIDGLLGFTPDTEIAPAKTPTCFSWESIALKMVEFLCGQTPTLADDDVASGNLICTNNGIRRGQASGSMLMLTDWSVIIAIHTYNATLGAPIGLGYFLPGVPASINAPTGPTNVTTAFNFTTIPGYDVAYKTAIIHFVLKGTTYGEWYDCALIVNDREYARIAVVGNADAGCDTCVNTFPFQIPDSGIATFKFIYQGNEIGPDSSVLAMAYCIGLQK